MNALKIETIQDKLFRLEQNAKLIEDIVSEPDKHISQDQGRYYGLEHILQIAIQIILDIGSHILAEQFKESPSDYAGVIEALGRNGIVSREFADKNIEMARFRNKLVHDYDLVDQKKVITYAKEAPAIFKEFGRAYKDFILKHKV